MIIGHVGVAYAAKRFWPRIPLAGLLIATFAADIVREVLVQADVDYFEANLYSHASPWCFAIVAVCGILMWLLTKDVSAGVVTAVVALSHIGLDAISGHKLLWYWGPHGLDLEANWPFEFILETVLLWIGWRLLRARSATRWVTSTTVLALLVIGQFVEQMGEISQRPYWRRCLAYPSAPCDERHLLTRKWNVAPFW